jgi:protein-disulfide isomerase
MRSLLLASTLLAVPGLALADPPQCALPSAPATAVSLPAPASAPAREADQNSPGQPPLISAEEIARVPALQRISSNGADLLDLGTEHGLRGVFARRGDVFQVFYITADGQAAVGGIMWSAAGKNLTRARVAPIDGVIPTVVVGTPGSSPPAARPVPASMPAPVPALKATETTTFGLAGDAKAPRLWVYIDPLCSFSVRAIDQLRPYVANGRVQIAVVPLSVLDPEDQGRSTLAAKAMLSLPPDQMIASWEASKLSGPADPAAGTRLASNMAAAEAIGLRGTPTFVWRRADGSEGRFDGLPDNLETIIASMGG